MLRAKIVKSWFAALQKTTFSFQTPLARESTVIETEQCWVENAANADDSRTLSPWKCSVAWACLAPLDVLSTAPPVLHRLLTTFLNAFPVKGRDPMLSISLQLYLFPFFILLCFRFSILFKHNIKHIAELAILSTHL